MKKFTTEQDLELLLTSAPELFPQDEKDFTHHVTWHVSIMKSFNYLDVLLCVEKERKLFILMH